MDQVGPRMLEHLARAMAPTGSLSNVRTVCVGTEDLESLLLFVRTCPNLMLLLHDAIYGDMVEELEMEEKHKFDLSLSSLRKEMTEREGEMRFTWGQDGRGG